MLVLFVGYILMEEASGNNFRIIIIVDYFDSKMPKEIALEMEKEFNLDANQLKITAISE
jgi:hypothetical protein